MKNVSIRLRRLPFIPLFSSSRQRSSCQTLSNAFGKSNDELTSNALKYYELLKQDDYD